MERVNFTKMEDGTAEEYAFLDTLEAQYKAALPTRLIETLRGLSGGLSGYQISRLEHSLQGATRAHRAGEDLELVMATLFHDIGDELAVYSHSEMAAAILRPFVSEKIYWIIKHHGVFQMYYYAHHCGGDRNTREMFSDSPWYEDAIHFCHEYDQNCFDPAYKTEPLEFFIPMIESFFSSPKSNDAEELARYGNRSAE
ncbi:MAG: HD domain-containing protein [Gammaproteobacteria bacterium]|nr:HD domain-containing protein [Gammaproteobacteria bacterium]